MNQAFNTFVFKNYYTANQINIIRKKWKLDPTFLFNFSQVG